MCLSKVLRVSSDQGAVSKLVGSLKRLQLSELIQEVIVVHGLKRILIGELRDHDLQEVFLPER